MLLSGGRIVGRDAIMWWWDCREGCYCVVVRLLEGMLSLGGGIEGRDAITWWWDCREGCYQSGKPGTLCRVLI